MTFDSMPFIWSDEMKLYLFSHKDVVLSGLELFSPHLTFLIEFERIYAALWVMDCFSTCIPFLIDEMLQTSHYSINISMANSLISNIPWFHHMHRPPHTHTYIYFLFPSSLLPTFLAVYLLCLFCQSFYSRNH